MPAASGLTKVPAASQGLIRDAILIWGRSDGIEAHPLS
jgi:hypothetical protein